MDALSISASGIRDSQLRLFSAANNIANMNTEAPIIDRVESSAAEGGGVESYLTSQAEAMSSVDMVSEAVNLKLASISAKANAEVIQATNSAMGTIMDIVNSKDD